METASAALNRVDPSFMQTSAFRHSFEVDVARVHPDPNQPRRSFDDEAIAALAETMRSEGQLQPILLRNHPTLSGEWIIVAGERRWRAAALNGWETMLAIPHEGDASTAALVENLQRADLTPVEMAQAIDGLVKLKGWTQQDASRQLGLPQSRISGLLRILTLPEDYLSQVNNGVAENALVELARLKPAEQEAIISRSEGAPITVRSVRSFADRTSPKITQTRRPRSAGSRFDVMLQSFQLSDQQAGELSESDWKALEGLKVLIDRLIERKTT